MQGVWILDNIYHIIGSLEKNKTRYSVIVFETPRERQNLQFLSGKKKLHEFKREKKNDRLRSIIIFADTPMTNVHAIYV